MQIICPRCKTKKISDEHFCESCLYDFTDPECQEYYARWLFKD